MSSPSPSPAAPPTSGFDVHLLLSSVLDGVWQAVRQAPWVGVLFALLVLGSLVGSIRRAIHAGHSRDPIRRFPAADRRVIFARAGNRCEFHAPVFGWRCSATTELEADHVHPYSRGGWTSISNGQALCRRHNREKSAAVPWEWQLRRLAKRRAGYFPNGHDPVVVRRRPAPRAHARRHDDPAVS